jgi:hypothetical protein
MNERERQPDREGYLDYCRKIEAGEADPSDSRAYRSMYRVERAVERALTPDPHGIVQLYELGSFQRLRRNDVRTVAVGAVIGVEKAWNSVRGREAADYREFHKANDFRYVTAERRAEHPRETEGQAWFKAKSEVERKLLARLLVQSRLLGRQLDTIATRAREQGGPQLGDPGYAEYRDQQRGKGRGGRER